MSIVVSDTSPIRALAHLNLLNLLRDLFGTVLIPPAVAEELRSPAWGPHPIEIDQLRFVTIRAPEDRNQVNRLRLRLDPGESEALALALEIRPEAILIDEAAGRAVAKELGLEPLGVLGVFLRAKRSGLIVQVAPLMERLKRELRFFVSRQLEAEILRLAGE